MSLLSQGYVLPPPPPTFKGVKIKDTVGGCAHVLKELEFVKKQTHLNDREYKSNQIPIINRYWRRNFRNNPWMPLPKKVLLPFSGCLLLRNKLVQAPTWARRFGEKDWKRHQLKQSFSNKTTEKEHWRSWTGKNVQEGKGSIKTICYCMGILHWPDIDTPTSC